MRTLIAVVVKTIILFFMLICLVQTTFANRATYGQRLCHSNLQLTCITVKKGQSWESLWPDPTEREMAMKVNRLNIRLYPGMQLVDPSDANNQAILERIVPFLSNRGAHTTRVILVNKKQLAWGAYDTDGTLVRWGPISSALGFCPDIERKCTTPDGIFVIYRKEGAECKSGTYPVHPIVPGLKGGAPMPYCMFFKGGYAIHGSNELPGYNASHGCVRILTDDAKWLNEDFITVGKTQVIVMGD